MSVFFILHHIRKFIMSVYNVCPIISDSDLDHLV